jgi:hypothetical protein
MVILTDGRASGHALNPLRARRSGLERIGKALGLAGHLAIQELHHAHRIGRPAVICEGAIRPRAD